MLGSLLDQDEIEEFMAEADAVTQFVSYDRSSYSDSGVLYICS